MDELELLKKDWQRKSDDYPKLSNTEIYKMSSAKSSSIVKWIFYISLIEFGFGIALLLINPKIEYQVEMPEWIQILTYISLPIIAVFIYIFYKNYRQISATDSVKNLMKSILKTRTSVKYYILFNLVFAGVISVVSGYVSYIDLSGGYQKFNNAAHFKEYATLGIVIVLITVLILGLIYGIYYMLYGILLKRLNKNYKELRKLEV